MKKSKLWALLIVALLLAATVAGAAQTKAPSKPAPSKAASADKPQGAPGHRQGRLVQHDQPGDLQRSEEDQRLALRAQREDKNPGHAGQERQGHRPLSPRQGPEN